MKLPGRLRLRGCFGWGKSIASGIAKTGLVYTLIRTEANVHDITQAEEFLLGSEAGDLVDA
jgi:hypothetical protein